MSRNNKQSKTETVTLPKTDNNRGSVTRPIDPESKVVPGDVIEVVPDPGDVIEEGVVTAPIEPEANPADPTPEQPTVEPPPSTDPQPESPPEDKSTDHAE
ncbi:hypothetical protein F4Z98_03095 [Candidatus Poribacteria bacterium]|nr:hypothetical protein [Candidatus Poribacteria bacterium]MYB01804.1 hypothetical protein [Candidatus Poribacteria bacterium]